MLMSKMDIQIRILWILHWQIKSVFCVQSAGFLKVCLFLFVSNVDLLVMSFNLQLCGLDLLFCLQTEVLIVFCDLYFHTVSILPEKTTFNVDNVRVCKILVSIVQILSKYYL